MFFYSLIEMFLLRTLSLIILIVTLISCSIKNNNSSHSITQKEASLINKMLESRAVRLISQNNNRPILFIQKTTTNSIDSNNMNNIIFQKIEQSQIFNLINNPIDKAILKKENNQYLIKSSILNLHTNIYQNKKFISLVLVQLNNNEILWQAKEDFQ